VTADPEARVRAAVAELAEALLALARPGTSTTTAPVELLSIAEFSRRAGLGRSSTYLAAGEGSIRTVKVRGRRLVPASELSRLAAEAGPAITKKAAPVIVSPGAAQEGRGVGARSST
jgi:hypothetical protein